MEKIIGLKEFRADVQKVAESVAKGNEYVVVKRSRPLFRVVPEYRSPARRVTDSEIAAWRKLAGSLKGRKGPDPLKWQKKIRRESERTFVWPRKP